MEREILEQLITEGKISKEDVVRIEDSIITPEKERVIDLFHNIICEKNHDSEECLWYVECQAKDTWKELHHAKWTRLISDKLRFLNIDFLEAEKLALQFHRMVSHTGEKAAVKELILFLLSSDLSKL